MPPRLSDVLGGLVESSSLHGLPRIKSSRQLTVKVLWALLLTGAIVVFGIQISSLFTEYYSYPIKTSVSLKNHPISYPAITFCNMNPVKKSSLVDYEELESVIYTNFKPKNRKTRSVQYEPADISTNETTSTASTPTLEITETANTTLHEATSTANTTTSETAETANTTPLETTSTANTTPSETAETANTTPLETTSTANTTPSETAETANTTPLETTSTANTTPSETAETANTTPLETTSTANTTPSETAETANTTPLETTSTANTTTSETAETANTTPLETTSTANTTTSETAETANTTPLETTSTANTTPSETAETANTTPLETTSTANTTPSETAETANTTPLETTSTANTTPSETAETANTTPLETTSTANTTPSETAETANTTPLETTSTANTTTSEKTSSISSGPWSSSSTASNSSSSSSSTSSAGSSLSRSARSTGFWFFGTDSSGSSDTSSGSTSNTSSESKTSNSSTDDDYYLTWGGWTFTASSNGSNFSDTSYCATCEDSDGGYTQYIKDQFYLAKDEWFERTIKIQTAFRNESYMTREAIGHNKTDLVLSASYSGILQEVSSFQSMSTSDYGNCFTMTSTKYRAWKSGPTTGIKLLFNLEIDEYLESYASGYGIRMVFHKPGTLPLPAEEGFTLSPGYETSIGLRMIMVNRLGNPYGECTDGVEFKEKYKIEYTVSTCTMICRSESVIATCGCMPLDGPDNTLLGSTSRVCNITLNDRLCVLAVDAMFDDGGHHCNCISPCTDTMFEKTLSGRVWPKEDYLDNALMGEVCQRNISSMEAVCANWLNDSAPFDYDKDCEALRTLISGASQRDHWYRNNFLQVLIYFEDLNYERIDEDPMYEFPRFLSDIGGAMGLFVGGSLLTFAELLQVILELSLYAYHHVNKHGREDSGNKNKIGEASTHNNVDMAEYGGAGRKKSPVTVFQNE